MYNFSKVIAVVLFLQVCTIITSTPAEKSSLSPQNKTDITNNATISNSNGHNTKTKVLTEGGGQVNAQMKPAVSQSRLGGREGEIASDKPAASNNKTVNPLPSVPTNSEAEIQGTSSTASSSTPSTPQRIEIPIYEDKPPTSNSSSKTAEHRTISARKGVNLTEYMEHQAMNVSTAKPKPKKPTLTIASDEEPFAPSHFQAKSNLSASQSIPKVPNLDMLNESNNNKGNTQKYVVPIVIVILSVPFVAILISVLYKRGSEWWKYRHYRRMDFLINGMYDN